MVDIDYGIDVSTFDDLDPGSAWITGPRIVAQVVARRWLTMRGTEFYDSSSGASIMELLNEGVTDQDIKRWGIILADEAEKDERVQSADVSVTLNYATFTLTIKATLELEDGPFVFNMSIDKVGLISLSE